MTSNIHEQLISMTTNVRGHQLRDWCRKHDNEPIYLPESKRPNVKLYPAALGIFAMEHQQNQRVEMNEEKEKEKGKKKEGSCQASVYYRKEGLWQNERCPTLKTEQDCMSMGHWEDGHEYFGGPGGAWCEWQEEEEEEKINIDIEKPKQKITGFCQASEDYLSEHLWNERCPTLKNQKDCMSIGHWEDGHGGAWCEWHEFTCKDDRFSSDRDEQICATKEKQKKEIKEKKEKIEIEKQKKEIQKTTNPLRTSTLLFPFFHSEVEIMNVIDSNGNFIESTDLDTIHSHGPESSNVVLTKGGVHPNQKHNTIPMAMNTPLEFFGQRASLMRLTKTTRR